MAVLFNLFLLSIVLVVDHGGKRRFAWTAQAKNRLLKLIFPILACCVCRVISRYGV